MDDIRSGSALRARRLTLLAIGVSGVIAGIVYWRQPPQNWAPEAGVVQLKPAVAPSPAAPVTAAPAPQPAPVAPMAPGPEPGPPVEMPVTPDALAALKLPRTAMFRDTTLKDSDDRVICGEVALSAKDPKFRRFIYIAESKAGFVDDGGPAFAQLNAATCAVGK